MTKITKPIPINDEYQFWCDSRRLVILLMLARASGPLTAVQIARQACAANETVSDKLRSLAKMGLVVRPRTYGGWFLTRQGWQVLHPSKNPPYPLIDGFMLAELAESVLKAGEDCPGSNLCSSQDTASSYPLTHSQVADSAMQAGENFPAPSPTSNEPSAFSSPPIHPQVADSAMQACENFPASSPTSNEPSASSSPPIHPKVADSAVNPTGDVADSSRKTTQIRDIALKKEESLKKKESKKEESIKDPSLDSSLDSSSDISDSSSTKQLSQAELLDHSPLLFGPPGVLPQGLPERSAQFVLSWLAQAYAQRKRLRAPAALVYKRLLIGDPPAALYRVHPEQHLPHAYLAAVNLAPSSYGTAGETAEDALDDGAFGDREDEEDTLPPDPSLLALVNGRSILASWEQAVTRLRAELSLTNYHTYLEPCRPQSWEPPGRLVIAAPTPYAREWLASRLSRLLERLLVGILAQPVEVVFTTDPDEG